MDNNGNLFNQVVNDNRTPAQEHALISLILGILSVALPALNFFIPEVSITGGLILGIVGLCLSVSAKKKGNTTGTRSSGQVLSIIGIVLGSLGFVTCVGCAGCLSCLLCTGLAGMAGMA